MHLSLPNVLLYLRVTARISAIFLAGAFAASALRLVWSSPITAWMAANRHRFTLLFALSHTFHLAGVAAMVSLIPGKLLSMPALLGLIAGGVGYVLIYYLAGMAFLRRKNPELPDSKIQTASLYILWAVFTLAFIGGARSNAWIYAPLASMMLLAFVARICARWVSAPGSRAAAAA
jgi:hypothetical protein